MLLILMKGHPGTGKSTLAGMLAQHLKCPLVDKDDARGALQALRGTVEAPLLNQISYDIMKDVVSRQLRCGMDVIVDCPLSRRAVLRHMVKLAEQVRLIVACRHRRV